MTRTITQGGYIGGADRGCVWDKVATEWAVEEATPPKKRRRRKQHHPHHKRRETPSRRNEETATPPKKRKQHHTKQERKCNQSTTAKKGREKKAAPPKTRRATHNFIFLCFSSLQLCLQMTVQFCYEMFFWCQINNNKLTGTHHPSTTLKGGNEGKHRHPNNGDRKTPPPKRGACEYSRISMTMNQELSSDTKFETRNHVDLVWKSTTRH